MIGRVRRWLRPAPNRRFDPRLSRFTENWRPGDLGVCVGPGPWVDMITGNLCRGPGPGALVIVARVFHEDGLALLALDGWPDAYQESNFRKVPPIEAEPPFEQLGEPVKRRQKV